MITTVTLTLAKGTPEQKGRARSTSGVIRHDAVYVQGRKALEQVGSLSTSKAALSIESFLDL